MTFPETFVPGFHDEESVRIMPYCNLGHTGLKISTRVGRCTSQRLIRIYFSGFVEDEAIETIKEAVIKGINYIDTAPYYGQGRSEATIGKALKDIPRKSYYLSTKVGRYTKEWESMFDFSAEKITQGFKTSLELLGLDYVDIVIIHDVEFADMKQILEETIPAVLNLVEAGKARYIGISGYPVSTLWEIINSSQIPINVVLTYSRDTLIDKTLYNFIPNFKEKKVGIINAAPTAMGLLTNKGPPGWHRATHDTKKMCAEAADYCKKNGVELGRLAVYHTMNNYGCDNVLIGMGTRTRLESNIQVITEGLNAIEEQVLDYLYKMYFPLEKNLHWEGIELAAYKNYLDAKLEN